MDLRRSRGVNKQHYDKYVNITKDTDIKVPDSRRNYCFGMLDNNSQPAPTSKEVQDIVQQLRKKKQLEKMVSNSM